MPNGFGGWQFPERSTSAQVVCAYRGAGPAPGDVWKAGARSTAELWRKADPCGQSGAPDQSPWCGELSCFRDCAHRHQR